MLANSRTAYHNLAHEMHYKSFIFLKMAVEAHRDDYDSGARKFALLLLMSLQYSLFAFEQRGALEIITTSHMRFHGDLSESSSGASLRSKNYLEYYFLKVDLIEHLCNLLLTE